MIDWDKAEIVQVDNRGSVTSRYPNGRCVSCGSEIIHLNGLCESCYTNAQIPKEVKKR